MLIFRYLALNNQISSMKKIKKFQLKNQVAIDIKIPFISVWPITPSENLLAPIL